MAYLPKNTATKGSNKLQQLLEWCQMHTAGYSMVNVRNFDRSWKDGLAFCALLHRFRPDLIDFSSLRPENVFENHKLAYACAEEHLGVDALLDPVDMVEISVPDRLSVITYIITLYTKLKDMKPFVADSTAMKTAESPSASDTGFPKNVTSGSHLVLANVASKHYLGQSTDDKSSFGADRTNINTFKQSETSTTIRTIKAKRNSIIATGPRSYSQIKDCTSAVKPTCNLPIGRPVRNTAESNNTNNNFLTEECSTPACTKFPPSNSEKGTNQQAGISNVVHPPFNNSECSFPSDCSSEQNVLHSSQLTFYEKETICGNQTSSLTVAENIAEATTIDTNASINIQLGGENSLADICAICHKQVYLLERRYDDNILYHRACISQEIRQAQRISSTYLSKKLIPDDRQARQDSNKQVQQGHKDIAEQMQPSEQSQFINTASNIQDQRRQQLWQKSNTIEKMVASDIPSLEDAVQGWGIDYNERKASSSLGKNRLDKLSTISAKKPQEQLLSNLRDIVYEKTLESDTTLMVSSAKATYYGEGEGPSGGSVKCLDELAVIDKQLKELEQEGRLLQHGLSELTREVDSSLPGFIRHAQNCTSLARHTHLNNEEDALLEKWFTITTKRNDLRLREKELNNSFIDAKLCEKRVFVEKELRLVMSWIQDLKAGNKDLDLPELIDGKSNSNSEHEVQQSTLSKLELLKRLEDDLLAELCVIVTERNRMVESFDLEMRASLLQ